MVYYIRFLKAPQSYSIGKAGQVVRALITITSDLGDDFFPSDLILRAKLTPKNNENDTIDQYQPAYWKAGMRVLWIEVDATRSKEMRPWRLLVTTVHQETATYYDSLSVGALCDIVSCRSDVTEPSLTKPVTARVERHFMLQPGNSLKILEDTGESIARHIWDAGIALVAFLANLADPSAIEPPTILANLLLTNLEPKVLELGSGCGIVGIAFTQLFPRCNVFLKDLPEAMEILDINIHQAMPALDAKLTRSILDWNAELPTMFKKTMLDLILVSDCTYNADSIPNLVRTLSALAAVSPNVLVLISLKKRHSSEAVLFDLLNAAGFREVYDTSMPLPDIGRIATGDSLENIEIYGYQNRRRVSQE